MRTNKDILDYLYKDIPDLTVYRERRQKRATLQRVRVALKSPAVWCCILSLILTLMAYMVTGSLF